MPKTKVGTNSVRKLATLFDLTVAEWAAIVAGIRKYRKTSVCKVELMLSQIVGNSGVSATALLDAGDAERVVGAPLAEHLKTVLAVLAILDGKVPTAASTSAPAKNGAELFRLQELVEAARLHGAVSLADVKEAIRDLLAATQADSSSNFRELVRAAIAKIKAVPASATVGMELLNDPGEERIRPALDASTQLLFEILGWVSEAAAIESGDFELRGRHIGTATTRKVVYEMYRKWADALGVKLSGQPPLDELTSLVNDAILALPTNTTAPAAPADLSGLAEAIKGLRDDDAAKITLDEVAEIIKQLREKAGVA